MLGITKAEQTEEKHTVISPVLQHLLSHCTELRYQLITAAPFCPLTLLPFLLLKVPPGSEVHFQPGNFSLSCHIQKQTLPHGNEHLLNWAQKKYRAVTSFSELRMTQDIYIKVGEGVCQIPKFPNIALGPEANLPFPLQLPQLYLASVLEPWLQVYMHYSVRRISFPQQAFTLSHYLTGYLW